jgi:hypothetical protein
MPVGATVQVVGFKTNDQRFRQDRQTVAKRF